MHQYSYDLAGNLLAVKNDGNTVTMASYTYTPEGLLETASFGASRTLENEWDADSNRVRLNVAAGQYDFTYDVTAGIPAVIEEVNAGASSTTTAYYFREPSGSLISRVEDSTTHYYHFDALGSTRLLTDGDGDITDKYAYDAYGALLSHDRLTAASIDQPYQYVGQLGYYTHFQEPDFALLQLGVRFYDAEVGRFTQRDPTGYGFDAYAYVDGRPVLFGDPLGLRPNYSKMSCADLRELIEGRTKELGDRYEEMLFDEWGLYELYCIDSDAREPTDDKIGNWIGHHKQYVMKQVNLNRMLDAWNKLRCECKGFRLPKHALEYARKPVPKKNAHHPGAKPCTPRRGPVSPYQ